MSYSISHDLEDLLSVIDGRASIIEEISNAPEAVKEYIAVSFSELLQNKRFEEALPGHLPPDSAGQGRLDLLTSRLRAISML